MKRKPRLTKKQRKAARPEPVIACHCSRCRGNPNTFDSRMKQWAAEATKDWLPEDQLAKSGMAR